MQKKIGGNQQLHFEHLQKPNIVSTWNSCVQGKKYMEENYVENYLITTIHFHQEQISIIFNTILFEINHENNGLALKFLPFSTLPDKKAMTLFENFSDEDKKSFNDLRALCLNYDEQKKQEQPKKKFTKWNKLLAEAYELWDYVQLFESELLFLKLQQVQTRILNGSSA